MLVYGTLKKGYGADMGTWHESNKLLDDHVTLNGYTMYSNGGYPMVIPGDGEIIAELWEVHPSCVADLDGYEGHPSLFKRTNVKISGNRNAEMYVFNRPIHPANKRVESGVF
jgi:gamma-glutamylcyclotransferase (GGCT)/AIG2-like uncharacterized protein YtfP